MQDSLVQIIVPSSTPVESALGNTEASQIDYHSWGFRNNAYGFWVSKLMQLKNLIYFAT